MSIEREGSRYIAWLTIEDVQGERKLKTRAGEAVALAGKANAPIRARVDQLVVRGVIFRRERTETAASGPIGSRKSAQRISRNPDEGREDRHRIGNGLGRNKKGLSAAELGSSADSPGTDTSGPPLRAG